MRTERFRGALLATLMIASLLAPMLALTSTAEAQEPITVVRGKDTAYNINQVGAPPWLEYKEGDRPLIMVAKRVGSGGVLAGGTASTCRNGRWNDPDNPYPYLDKLLDAAFQWMVPGATKVLWYEGHNVYNTSVQCSDLVAALGSLGYSVTPDSTQPITSGLLAPYDIFVIAQMQEGTSGTGGDPTKIADAEVTAIRNFVEGGGRLVIMEASDFMGYNYNKVQNKVLACLSFDYYFQDDQVSDPTNNWGADYLPIVDVDTTTDIGSAYQTATGATEIGLYSICSLAEGGPSISLNVLPDYQVGMPGVTLEYTITVANPENPLAENLTYNLTVEENAGWSLSINPTSLSVPIGESREAILGVTIPSDTPLSTEDNILVIAVASGYPEVKDNFICIAHTGKRIEPTDDMYVSTQDNDANYSGENSLRIGRYYEYWQWPYLKFDLSQIPPGAKITDARLCLCCYYKYVGGFDVLCHEVDNDAWFEDLVTWNNKPEPGTILDIKFVDDASRDSPKSYSWDVTPFVVNEFAGDKRVSFCLRPPDNLPPTTSRAFWSREHYEDRVRPFLRVSYTTGVVENPIADVYAFGDENGYSRSQLKFDISSIPSGSNILSAKLWLYRFAADNWDGEILLNRVENQVWGENITAIEFDAQILTDGENHAGKFISPGWDYLDVENQLNADHEAGHTYSSYRLRWANDNGSEPSIGIDDGRFLMIESGLDELSIIFYSSEYNGRDPYLEVVYLPLHEWNPIETWTGTIEAFAEWQVMESWTGTVSAPVEWNLIETWTGTVSAPAAWQLIETWTGMVKVPAPVAWQLVETWTGTVSAPAAWQLIETWTGTVKTPAIDIQAPTSSVDPISPYWRASVPFAITATASDATSGVASVGLFYRYSTDNFAWGAWTSFGIDTASPWSFLFTAPSGDGYYEFYSIASDVATNTESAPAAADAIAGVDTTAPTGSVVINDGATYATSTSVTLALTYTDATSGVSRVRYSNDNVWDTELWEDPSVTKAWTLSDGDGTKTVYYQIKDKAGLLSPIYFDTIILDTTPLDIPALISPSDGAVTYDNKPTFDWEDITGAVEYQLQVDNDPDFSSPEILVTVTVSTYTPMDELPEDNYSWRVRAKDATDKLSGWSEVWTFFVAVRAPGVEIPIPLEISVFLIIAAILVIAYLLHRRRRRRAARLGVLRAVALGLGAALLAMIYRLRGRHRTRRRVLSRHKKISG